MYITLYSFCFEQNRHKMPSPLKDRGGEGGGGKAPIYRMKGRCSILTPIVKKLACVVGGLGGGGV